MSLRFDFYHLQRMPLEQALPRLMERVLAAGQRAVILGSSDDQLAAIDTALWTFDPGSWVPHGSRKEGGPPEDQPIWLTVEEENPNGSTVLVLLDSQWPRFPVNDQGHVIVAATPSGADPEQSPDSERTPVEEGFPFQRILILFDGRDEAAVQTARGQWVESKGFGAALHYWQQKPNGGWEEKHAVAAKG